MTLTLGHFLTLSTMLPFWWSEFFEPQDLMACVRMAIEMMLLSVNMNFVAFFHYLGDMHGQSRVLHPDSGAASEAAIRWPSWFCSSVTNPTLMRRSQRPQGLSHR